MLRRKQIPITHPPRSSFADTLYLIAEAEEMRRSLKKFVMGCWSYIDPAPFVDGWVLDAICEHYEAVTRGQIRFLLVNIPPRCSKSSVGSVAWPVWDWLQIPEDRFLCASYSLELAIRDNLKKRELIESPFFQERYRQDFTIYTPDNVALTKTSEFTLSQSQNAKRFFINDKLGYQLACSVGSQTTGSGGSKLLIDDPHSAMEAHSEADRRNAATWFRETWSNRQNDPAKDAMVVVGQRIHEEDVSGLIRSERPDWVFLDLPMEYEPHRKCFTVIGWSDPRTEPGQLLWPERFDKATIERYKRDLGSIGYASQYQQSPVPSDGGQIKQQWFRYFTETPQAYMLERDGGTSSVLKSECWRFATVDLAISSKQTADYTVIQVYDVTPQNDLLLIEQIRDRMDNPQQVKVIRLLHRRLHPEYFVIESVGYQLAIIQQLRDEVTSAHFLLVQTENPAALDATIQQLVPIGGFLLRSEATGEYLKQQAFYIACALDVNYFKFACEQQGYCRVIGPAGPVAGDASVPVKEYKPTRDKVSRFAIVAVQMEAEKIFMRKNDPYLQVTLPEMLRFPLGANDDICDNFSMACDEITLGSHRIPIAISGYTKQEEPLPTKHDVDDEALMKRQELMSRLLGDIRSNPFGL